MGTKISSYTSNIRWAASLFLCLFFLGCGLDGKDGTDGADGATGSIGPTGDSGQPTSAGPVTSLTATVTSVTIEGAPIVEFTVVDQDGVAYVGLTGPRFSLVKLIPEDDGDASYWQSYINREEVADGIGPGIENTIQATQDRDGELFDNEDGSYRYIFENDVTTISDPMVVEYEPTLTHRLAIQISGGGLPATNAVYTWRPSDGAIIGIDNRDIVKTESCNQCHNKLALHGGGRIEAQLCVTCHNPGTVDANSGNTVDFKVMIHKIHRGASLPSVEAGGEYAIWGFRDNKHDYSDLHLPMDIRNCTKCHDDTDEATPQAINWQMVPTMEACGSCHDDVDFALGMDGGHEGGVMVDNSGCTICHTEGGFAGSVVDSHIISEQVAATNFKYTILDVIDTAPGDFPTVTFEVTNPNTGDTPYDILSDPEFTSSGASLSVDLAWNTADYTNDGSGSGVARAASTSALTNAVDNGDGTFDVTSSVAIPLTQSGSGGVGIEGHPVSDLDGDGTYSDRTPVTGEVDYFAITDGSPIARREVVSLEKCQACHVNINFHGSNRNDKIELCVMCHNPSNTDLDRRPVDPSDGLLEQTVDMKYMIHAIHGSGKRENDYVVYGFGNREHNFSEVHFPGEVNQCTTCHLEDTYTLPLTAGVQGTTISTGADKADRSDDLKITPMAAVCSSCHDDRLSQAHMEQNGGAAFSTSQEAIDEFDVIETCQFCHGDGAIKDVNVVHGIEGAGD